MVTDVFYNFQAMGRLLTIKGLSCNEYRVLSVLIRRMGENYTCYPSKSTISEDAEISSLTTDRVLKSLCQKDFLVKSQRYNDEGGKSSNLYQLGSGFWGTPSNVRGTTPSNVRGTTPSKVGCKVDTLEVDTMNKPFGDFWAVYPNKRGKANAEKRWAKMTEDEKDKAISDVVNRKKSDEQWTKDGGKYIPHASTYLNGQQWQDEWQADGVRDGFSSMFGTSTRGKLL